MSVLRVTVVMPAKSGLRKAGLHVPVITVRDTTNGFNWAWARVNRAGHRGIFVVSSFCRGSFCGGGRGCCCVIHTRTFTIPVTKSVIDDLSRTKTSLRGTHQWSLCATQPTEAVGLGPGSCDWATTKRARKDNRASEMVFIVNGWAVW